MRILRSIAGVLAAVMFMLSAVSGLSFADDDIETPDVIDTEMGLRYTLLEDDTFSVELELDCVQNLPNDLVIPSEYNGRTVTTIGGGGFRNCTNLISVTIPETITTIIYRAFSNCINLTSVNISKGVMDIGDSVFEDCDSLENIDVDEDNEFYCSDDGILLNKNETELILYPAAKSIEKYIVPTNIIKISNGAFAGHEELDSIVLHDNIVSIGNQAFSRCTKLNSVMIPKSVMYIGVAAFSSCESLTSVVIESEIETISEFTFNGCKNLETMTVPDTITNILDGAFMNCEKLSLIDIPDTVKNIGVNTFYGSGLTYIKIPMEVSKISYGTFMNCYNLKSIYIPESVVKVEGNCFENNGIEDVYYEGTESQWKEIEIEHGNSVLETATVHYNSTYPDDKKPDNTDPGDEDSGDPDNSGSNKPTPSVPSYPDNSGNNTQTPEEPDVDEPVTPPVSDKGEFGKDTILGDGVVEAEIVTPLGSLMDAVLTDEERKMLENGIDISVVLDINSANSSVSETDKRVAEDALSGLGYTAGLYLDVKLFKSIGDEQSQVDTTYEPITLSFEIPENLRKADRKYVMIRVHNGVADVLNDYDENENTITIRTDKFSTYVLAYYDEPSVSITPSDGNGSTNDNPYTNGDSHAKFYFTAGIVSLFVFIMLCLFTGRNGMTEEQKEQKFSKLIAWGKRGGKVRAAIALTVILLLLSFYYGIGMKRSAK